MRREWTEQEVEYLEKYYDAKGPTFIAGKLDRTVNSVKRKAQNLGYNAYICEDIYVKTIAKCFDCDSSVVNRWIDKFGLPYRRVQRGQAICKLISTNKFWKWAENHKELIPWSKYERLSILPEPEWIDETIKSYAITNNRKKVSSLESQYIISLRRKGKSFEEIAVTMNRTVHSVKHIWRKRQGMDI